MAKKKILLLSDDLRMSSGIASQSRELVLATVHKYDWVQVAGAMKHPDAGQVIDWSKEAQSIAGVADASVKLITVNGYGDGNLLRQIMVADEPDAILHFTDPRFWGWLYAMEHEIRQVVPLMYWNIWDNLPFPYWNEPFYESCDLLMAISMQTYNINKHVGRKFPKPDWGVKYVPHGINDKIYHPVAKDNEDLVKFKDQLFGNLDITFSVLFVNRNIKRKHPSDIIMAYKAFCDNIDPEDAQKCALIMHTQPVSPDGTDLLAVAETLCPEYKIIFTAGQVDVRDLNLLYNAADVTINLASNEGFGLTTAESLSAGTPIIVNVTGGLQDQCGFEKDGRYILPDDFDENWASNSDGLYKTHGEWVEPVWPSIRTLQGSPATPYIFDEVCRWEDAAEAILNTYKYGPLNNEARGIAGREFITRKGGLNAANLGETAIDAIDGCFANWQPRQRFDIFSSTEKPKPVGTSGFITEEL